MEDEIRMAPSPGKFEGETELTRILWECSLEGSWADEQIDGPNGETAELICGPISAGEVKATLRGVLSADELDLTDAELSELNTTAGVILTSDSQGFVYGRWFDHAETLEAAWAEISA